MFNKFLIFFFIFINFFINVHANEKKLIIDRITDINNIIFDFKQTTNDKKEMGKCILVFDNKLSCDYEDSMQKRILINNKTLVVMQKRYDKIYFYPISKSPFLKILSKNNLIDLVRESNLELNDNIDLVYTDKNEKKITVFFEKKNYDLIGWAIEDKFQNEIYFSLKIQSTNTKIDDKLFKIPSIN